MGRGFADRIELTLDGFAAAILAGATSVALVAAGLGAIPTAASAFVIFLVTLRSLRAVDPRRAKAATEFAVAPLLPELLLTQVHDTAQPDELVLDDMLEALSDDSRVVRLFDRATMPTPGELKSRIDRHLEASPRPETPDGMLELQDALAKLRRSLR